MPQWARLPSFDAQRKLTPRVQMLGPTGLCCFFAAYRSRWVTTKEQNDNRVRGPSGKFNVRIPVSMHADLIRHAEKQGVSLNALVSYLLAGALGWKDDKPRPRKPANDENDDQEGLT